MKSSLKLAVDGSTNQTSGHSKLWANQGIANYNKKKEVFQIINLFSASHLGNGIIWALFYQALFAIAAFHYHNTNFILPDCNFTKIWHIFQSYVKTENEGFQKRLDAIVRAVFTPLGSFLLSALSSSLFSFPRREEPADLSWSTQILL